MAKMLSLGDIDVEVYFKEYFFARSRCQWSGNYALCVLLHLCAKFEVSSFNRSRDIRGPKITKVDHVTPHDPF